LRALEQALEAVRAPWTPGRRWLLWGLVAAWCLMVNRTVYQFIIEADVLRSDQ